METVLSNYLQVKKIKGVALLLFYFYSYTPESNPEQKLSSYENR